MVRRNYCFRGWKKSHGQGILRKGIFAWLIHFVVFDGCWWIWESDSILSGSHTGESVLALQVKLWKKERVFEDEIFIENTCFEISSKKRGTKFKWGRSFKHWSRGSPGQWLPETDCLCASAIFVSGTSGIPPILNYRSVSPIVIPIIVGARERESVNWKSDKESRLYRSKYYLYLQCKDNSKIAIWAPVKTVAKDMRFIIPRNSRTDVLKDSI